MVLTKRSLIAFAVGLLCLSPVLQADRYYTWVDEQGNLRSTVIEEDNPLIDEQGNQEGDSSDPAAQPDGSARYQGAEQQPASPEQPLPQPVPQAHTPPTESQAGQADDNPVFNLGNFPDAEALEAAGYVREGDPEPFYTWTDATGRIHNTPFNPGREIQIREAKARKAMPDLLLGNEQDFSPAQILRRTTGLPAEADSLAAAVLGVNGPAPALMEAFTRECCEALEKGAVHQLDPDRGTSLRVDADTPVYDFPSGRSRYRVVELPVREGIFSLKLRSFINEGVFLPTLVFLDQTWEPVRLVTDIAFSYEPESWYRYGYLEARLPVEAEADERWLLVLSKAGDLQPVFDEEPGEGRPYPGHLRASATGELELSLDPDRDSL